MITFLTMARLVTVIPNVAIRSCAECDKRVYVTPSESFAHKFTTAIMSPTRKRKLTPDLESIFESISSQYQSSHITEFLDLYTKYLTGNSFCSSGLLSTIKPKLNDSSRSWTPALADLKQIAVLAESFSKQRPKSDESCLHLLNVVDREGMSGSFYWRSY